MNNIKVVMNWSSGKDAALTYHTILHGDTYQVTHLLTTLSHEHNRVFMHGVKEELLDIQAQRMNLPLIKVKLPASTDDALYRNAMLRSLVSLKELGVSTAAYGDIFLEDLKVYREQQLATAGFHGLFPLWKLDTKQVIKNITDAGIEAVIVCVNEQYLGKEYLGKKIDLAFFENLPANVDPCGENGEFHTFVYNAPFFSDPISISFGEIVHKTYKAADGDSRWDTGFYFLDVSVE